MITGRAFRRFDLRVGFVVAQHNAPSRIQGVLAHSTATKNQPPTINFF
ncbi:hypothetical protein [Fischerella sp. JS2]|nr:hypothetical protein [Fischerella sp. JS2]